MRAGSTPSSRKISTWRGSGADGGHRVGHDRRARLHAGARDGAVDLLDVVGHAGGVGGALQERGLDVGALDAAFDVLDEVVGHDVDVAVLEVVGEMVVAVDAGAGDDAHAGLVGDLLHEAHVAPAEHGGRLDDRAHAVALGGVGGEQRGVELELLVVAARPLRGDGLVAEAQVLVHQHQSQLVRVDGSLHGLYARHLLSLPRSFGEASGGSSQRASPVSSIVRRAQRRLNHRNLPHLLSSAAYPQPLGRRAAPARQTAKCLAAICSIVPIVRSVIGPSSRSIVFMSSAESSTPPAGSQ